MATVAIDENVIKLTSETLGKVIKQVPLTEKLLSRPPFKFIHDIIKEVSTPIRKVRKAVRMSCVPNWNFQCQCLLVTDQLQIRLTIA